jgi:YgiT-type zinc finger domain-containing protein
MENKKCNFRGNQTYEERRIDYLYSHKGEYLLVPNTPVEVCSKCGMLYYSASVLKEIERQFFAIQNKTEKPDKFIRIPSKAFV